MAKFSPHYKLVKRPSPYELIPTGRKGASLWLTFSAFIIGIICIGPNVLISARLFQAFYRLGMAALMLVYSLFQQR